VQTTLTIRLSDKERKRVRKRARRQKKSESQVVRDLINGLEDKPRASWDEIEPFAGCIRLDPSKLTGWAKTIYEHNWRK
jgi:hypothetical protein